MTHPSAPRLTTGDSPRPGLAAFVCLLLALLLLSAGLLVAGCGSSADGLATAVTDTWAEAMQDLVALLEDKPDAAVILPEVQALEEEYIQRLVELGHQRETLSATDSDRANSLEMLAFKNMADETWYTAYDTLWSYYADIDLDPANLMGSFNYLTQYSDLQPLKEQAPEEATRLGLD